MTSTMAQHAFLRTDADEFIDLGPGFAWSINKSGAILGRYVTSNSGSSSGK